MLTIEALHAGYGHVSVLRGVDLALPGGTVGALLGPNGAGKSTLLKACAGLVPVERGAIRAQDESIVGLAPWNIARRGVCYIPEGGGVFHDLTVAENLALSASCGGIGSYDQAIEAFPFLSARLPQLAGSLSGGEKRMLALARALLWQRLRVLLIDEPSLGLAPIIVDQVFESFRVFEESGISLLIVEQYADRALELASHVWVLSNGEVAFTGSPAELRQNSSGLDEMYLG